MQKTWKEASIMEGILITGLMIFAFIAIYQQFRIVSMEDQTFRALQNTRSQQGNGEARYAGVNSLSVRFDVIADYPKSSECLFFQPIQLDRHF